jgi:flagellar basal-body rod protein FlgB
MATAGPTRDHTMIKQLTDTLNFQTQALVLRSERQRLIASNIANADTPGYKSRDMDFARALKEATGAAGSSAMAATQAGHISPPAGARSDAQMLYGAASQTNLDNNSVDMDRERASFADNSVKYEATLRFINASVRTTLDAMKSPNAA